jgi:hypothetical protein
MQYPAILIVSYKLFVIAGPEQFCIFEFVIQSSKPSAFFGHLDTHTPDLKIIEGSILLKLEM